MKRCSKCGNKKRLKAFPDDKRRSDGKFPQCLACVRERAKVWRRNNRAKHRSYNAEYQKTHRVRLNEKARERYVVDPVAAREAHRRKRDANPEVYRAAEKRWRKNNPDKRADNEAKRRARKKNATIEDVDRAFVYARDGGRCYLCGNRVNFYEMHLDHVVALANGGEHSYENCRTSCPSCNLKKGAKLVVA